LLPGIEHRVVLRAMAVIAAVLNRDERLALHLGRFAAELLGLVAGDAIDLSPRHWARHIRHTAPTDATIQLGRAAVHLLVAGLAACAFDAAVRPGDRVGGQVVLDLDVTARAFDLVLIDVRFVKETRVAEARHLLWLIVAIPAGLLKNVAFA